MKPLLPFALLACLCGQAQAAEQAMSPCLTSEEMSALITVAAPELLKAESATCVQLLPPNAVLRQPSHAALSRFRTASDDAWLRAIAGLRRYVASQGQQLAEIGPSSTASDFRATLAPKVKDWVRPAVAKVSTGS